MVMDNVVVSGSQWALTDDEINAAKYVEDDDSDYQFEVAGISIPTFWVIMLVVLFSACVGFIIFLISYYYDRKPPTEKQAAEEEAARREKVAKRRREEIERGLKLKVWENIGDVFNDDRTRNSSSDEEDLISVVSEVSNVSETSILIQDPAFLRLTERPRCVLCSKFFTEADTVTESWEPTCKHNFHQECLVCYLQKNDGCPICKKAYVVGIGVAEEP